MTELEHFRAQKDAFFKTHPQSPLTAKQRSSFDGLRYFPENPELRLILPLEAFAEQDTIVMRTSTGDERAYTRFGRLHFTVEGQEVALTLYADEHDGGYFLPFVDALLDHDRGFVAKRYPAPRTVSIYAGSAGSSPSFLRRLAICTSTTRSSPKYCIPQTRSSRSDFPLRDIPENCEFAVEHSCSAAT